MKLANFSRDLSDQLSGGPAIVASTPVTAHAAGTASMHVASAVTIADAGNFYATGTVEGALQELGTAVGTAYVLSAYGGKETLDSGNTGTAYTIDLANGNVHDLTINAGTAVLTLTGATNLYACSITVLLRQDATGNRLVTWPGSVEWPGGTTPTLGTAANGVDVFSLFTLDGGTVWYGFEAGGAAGTASNTVLIYDEGSLMGTATAVDFLGSGVSAAMSGGTAQVTVTAGTASTSIPIYDEGTLMGTATTGLNFVGDAVSGTVTSGTAVITITSATSDETPDDLSLWASTLSESYEFSATGTALPSGWSWVNQGSSSYSEKYGVGALTVPQDSNWRGIFRSLPTSWTYAIAKLALTSVQGTTMGVGLTLRESSSGKLAPLGWMGDTASRVAIQKWTNVTTYSASIGTVDLKIGSLVLYLRITRNSASSWDFHVATLGNNWYPLATAHDLSSFMTANEIGLAGYSNNAGVLYLAADWLRFQ